MVVQRYEWIYVADVGERLTTRVSLSRSVLRRALDGSLSSEVLDRNV